METEFKCITKSIRSDCAAVLFINDFYTLIVTCIIIIGSLPEIAPLYLPMHFGFHVVILMWIQNSVQFSKLSKSISMIVLLCFSLIQISLVLWATLSCDCQISFGLYVFVVILMILALISMLLMAIIFSGLIVKVKKVRKLIQKTNDHSFDDMNISNELEEEKTSRLLACILVKDDMRQYASQNEEGMIILSKDYMRDVEL